MFCLHQCLKLKINPMPKGVWGCFFGGRGEILPRLDHVYSALSPLMFGFVCSNMF